MTIPTQLQKFLDLLPSEIKYSIDGPDDPAGEWFIDFENFETISFKLVFGFYDPDSGYGEKPSEIIADPFLAAEKIKLALENRK